LNSSSKAAICQIEWIIAVIKNRRIVEWWPRKKPNGGVSRFIMGYMGTRGCHDKKGRRSSAESICTGTTSTRFHQYGFQRMEEMPRN